MKQSHTGSSSERADTRRYTPEMMLRSDSGYGMPFEERNNDVKVSLGYGDQIHPYSGEPFFHHGIDFNVSHYMLAAVATGTVTTISRNAYDETYLIIQYGNYEVMYDHLGAVFVHFGQKVRARQKVGVSTSLLHIEVRYEDEEIDPLEFLSMLYANMMSTEFEHQGGEHLFAIPALDIKNGYEDYEDEIEELMLRFYPDYMNAIARGTYQVPDKTVDTIKDLFSPKTIKECFFETLPNIANPYGMGDKSIPLIIKAQNTLIEDLLNYLSLYQNVVLSSTLKHHYPDVKKKNVAG